VFAGGCTLDAAEQVCDADLETIDSLVDKSLVRHEGQRFTMLETIHEYARERLVASGEADPVARCLAERLVEAGEMYTALCDRGEDPSIAPLERELDNIRAAIRTTLAWKGDPLVLRLTAALRWFWTNSGRYAEGLRWTVEALEHAEAAPTSLRAESLRTAAQLATLAGDAEQGRALGEEALHRAAGDDWQVGEVLRWLAMAHTQAGDSARARTLHTESVALQERLGTSLHLARALRLAGESELELGDPIRAGELFRRALGLARGLEATREVVVTLHSLGDVALMRGELAAAADFYLEALGSSTQPLFAANCLAGLAAVAARKQLSDQAGRIWGAVVAHGEHLGERLILPQTLRRYEAAFAAIQGTAFAEGLAAGHALTLEAAGREAVEAFRARDQSSAAGSGPGG
jgi:tetratricopeptide (TPR) repeat protein